MDAIRSFTIIIKKHPDILGIILVSVPDMIGFYLLVKPDYKELLAEAK